MMDCVLPTRAARHGLLFTSEGRLNIKGKRYAEDQGPPDPACQCMVCRRYTRAYLRHLMQAGEALSATLNTIHNLAYYLGSWNACGRASTQKNELEVFRRAASLRRFYATEVPGTGCRAALTATANVTTALTKE